MPEGWALIVLPNEDGTIQLTRVGIDAPQACAYLADILIDLAPKDALAALRHALEHDLSEQHAHPHESEQAVGHGH